MMKNKISKFLLVAICLTLLVGVFVGCNRNQVDEATLNALNDHFKGSEVEIQRSFGIYNDATVVLVKSQAIQDTLRKDTINGIEFDYARQTQLLVVKNSQVYTLKDAYLNLLLDSTTLREIQTTYNKKIKLESGAEYEELGKEIVLEEKRLWDERELEEIDDSATGDLISCICVTVDKNFDNYVFTESDFGMININSIELLNKDLVDTFEGNYPEWFHNMYLIKLSNSGKQNLKDAIKILEQLDFVRNANTLVNFGMAV